jgi:hypothetical protein
MNRMLMDDVVNQVRWFPVDPIQLNPLQEIDGKVEGHRAACRDGRQLSPPAAFQGNRNLFEPICIRTKSRSRPAFV